MSTNEFLFLEKSMHKDRWGIPVPAEWSKQIGLEKGEPVYIGLDSYNNRIILTSNKNESVLNLMNQSRQKEDLFDTDYLIDMISNILENEPEIKTKVLGKVNHQHVHYVDNRLPSVKTDKPVTKRRGRPKGSVSNSNYIEKCYYCHKELDANRNYLRVNGRKICSDCKKIEVQRFLLYLERRRSINGKE